MKRFTQIENDAKQVVRHVLVDVRDDGFYFTAFTPKDRTKMIEHLESQGYDVRTTRHRMPKIVADIPVVRRDAVHGAWYA